MPNPSPDPDFAAKYRLVKAKNELVSLLRQFVGVSLGFGLMLLVTHGKPPEWLVAATAAASAVGVLLNQRRRAERQMKQERSRQEGNAALPQSDRPAMPDFEVRNPVILPEKQSKEYELYDE